MYNSSERIFIFSGFYIYNTITQNTFFYLNFSYFVANKSKLLSQREKVLQCIVEAEL